jgi:hypothetical protein
MNAELHNNLHGELMPMTEHDQRIVRDTVLRSLKLHEVDLLLCWTTEISKTRPLSTEEQAMHDLLLAQHCTLYAQCLQQRLINQRKDDRERENRNQFGGGGDPLSDPDTPSDGTTQYDAGVG